MMLTTNRSKTLATPGILPSFLCQKVLILSAQLLLSCTKREASCNLMCLKCRPSLRQLMMRTFMLSGERIGTMG